MKKLIMVLAASVSSAAAFCQMGPFPIQSAPVGGFATSATIRNGTAYVHCDPCPNPCVKVSTLATGGYSATVYDKDQKAMVKYEFSSGTGTPLANGGTDIVLKDAKQVN